MKKAPAAALILSWAIATGAVQAHQPPVPGAVFTKEHRQFARQFFGQEYGGKCPPGLQRQGDRCAVTGPQRKYAIGTRLPGDAILDPVPQTLLARLPAVPAGYRYVRVGEDIVLLAPGPGIVVDILAAVLP